jgi:hypothetical protein
MEILILAGIIAVIAAMVAAMYAGWIRRESLELKQTAEQVSKDWMVIKKITPLEADMLECGQCLRRCSGVIEDHAHTKTGVGKQ